MEVVSVSSNCYMVINVFGVVFNISSRWIIKIVCRRGRVRCYLFVIGVGDDVGDINDCIIVIISISYFYLVGILYIWVFYFKLNISFSNGVI